MSSKRVLVVGGGGREHALALALKASPSVGEVLVNPGNAGTRGGGLVSVAGDAFAIARDARPDLVVVGPEAPLCDGLADRLGAAGLLCFGPSARAAELEGSKAFMKEFAARHRLPTARFELVTDAGQVARVVRSFDTPPVVKADGLCAGKGVTVASDHAEAEAAARAMLSGESFGQAGRRVVIEERLDGQEASVHAICDGERVLMLPAAQDHKRIGDGDTGPNTGGMGTYAPAPVVSPELLERVRREIVEPTVVGLAAEGRPYRGVLFAGLMISNTGEPRLLEFNVRFGDPETQVLMALLDGDLAGLLSSAASGHLDGAAVRFRAESAVCVVLAAAGYPGTPRRGDVIEGLDRTTAVPGVRVLHAGTERAGDAVLTAGGRVLSLTARAPTLKEARDRAYEAAEHVRFEGRQMRRDIARRALSAS